MCALRQSCIGAIRGTDRCIRYVRGEAKGSCEGDAYWGLGGGTEVGRACREPEILGIEFEGL